MTRYKWLVIAPHVDGKSGLKVYCSKEKTPYPPLLKHMELLFTGEKLLGLEESSAGAVRSNVKELVSHLIEVFFPDQSDEYRVIDITSEDFCRECGEIEKLDYLESEVVKNFEDIQESIKKEKGFCRSCFKKECEEYQELAVNASRSFLEELSKMNDFHYKKFEKYIALLLKELGLDFAEVNSDRPDWGIDVVATWKGKKIGIQCKNQKNKQSLWAIQQVYSGAVYFDCDYAVVINTKEFTPNAIQMANKLNVHLVDKDKLTSIVKGLFENKNKDDLIRQATGNLELL